MKSNLTFPVNTNIAHEHSSARDTHILEYAITIILGNKAELGTDISYFNTWNRSMGVKVSKRHKERLDSMPFAIDDELSVDNTMG